MALIANVPNTLPVPIQGEDGPLTLAAPPTVFLRDPDGAVASTGAATGTAPNYVYTVPPLARVGVYTLEVSGLAGAVPVSGTWPVSVQAGVLFSVPELRSSDTALEDTARYSTAALRAVRDAVEDEFYAIAGRAFTVRGAVEEVALIGGRFYLSPVDIRSVVAAKVDGATVSDLSGFGVDFSGEGYCPVPGSVLHIEYKYGMPVVPADVKRAALIRARTVAYAADSGIPDRATSFQSAEGGNFTLATAGRAGFETGIPEVDAILSRYRVKPPGVA